MQVVQKLESFRIPLLRSFNRLRFRQPGALRLSWVGQVAFPGRMLSDAANYLYVVLVAARFGMATCPVLPTRITKPVALVHFASEVDPGVTFVTLV
jgi:hypothetical protein